MEVDATGGRTMATDTMLERRGTLTSRLLGPLATVLGLALALTLLLPPPTVAADDRPCRVRNAMSGQVYRHLGQAIAVARAGDKLVVTGVCRSQAVIKKQLRIVGRDTRGRHASLIAWPERTGTAITVRRGVTVAMSGIRITGDREFGTTGILNRGRLRLRNVRVRGLRVGIRNLGSLAMLGRSLVAANGNHVGSGIRNSGRLVLAGTSRVVDNDGVNIYNTGTVIMRVRSRVGGEVTYTRATVENRGRFVMRGASRISRAGATDSVFVNRRSGRLVMRGTSSIHHGYAGYSLALCHHNRADGGGVRNLGTVVMKDRASIHHNTAYVDDPCHDGIPPATGGGIHNAGTLRMVGSSRVYGNSVRRVGLDLPVEGEGGGIYNAGTLLGVRCGDGGNVFGNAPDDCYFAE